MQHQQPFRERPLIGCLDRPAGDKGQAGAQDVDDTPARAAKAWIKTDDTPL
jgi:hypothetical protein